MTGQHVISTVDELRALLGEPHPLNLGKSMGALDEHCRAFLAMSTFCTVATCSAAGKMDVSPKGDPPGFVKVLDDRTLAVPERPGNRRCDTFTNVLEHPAVGLIFLVPGIEETLRISGTASLSTEPRLLESMAVEGKVPKLALLVHVEEVFMHCAKALKRGAVWGDQYRVADRGGLPGMGELLYSQGDGERFGLSRDRLTEMADNDYRNNVY